MPERASCERFSFAGRVLYARDASDDILPDTCLGACQIAVSHKYIQGFARVASFDTDEAVEHIPFLPVRRGYLRQKDVSFFGQPLHRREDDRVFVAFDERAHTDAGRRETHFLSFCQQPC